MKLVKGQWKLDIRQSGILKAISLHSLSNYKNFAMEYSKSYGYGWLDTFIGGKNINSIIACYKFKVLIESWCDYSTQFN